MASMIKFIYAHIALRTVQTNPNFFTPTFRELVITQWYDAHDGVSA